MSRTSNALLLTILQPRSYLAACGAFALLLLVFFFPAVFGGHVIAPLDILDHLMRPWSDGSGGLGVHNAFVYDAISQYLPYDWTISQSLKQDGYIGWNPYVYGGYALLENTMICPGDWHHQLYRFLDFWTAWDLGIVLQFAIAGFGVLLMLRAEGLPAWAALVGAVSFAFYSQHVLWIYHRWILGASCWFPWIVWAVRRARRENRILDFWSVVFTALAFRGGHLQSCLFVALLVLCLFLADWLPRPWRWKPRTIIRAAMPFAVLAVLASVLILDVILDTVPTFLEGCRQLPRKSPLKALKALPTLVTAINPTLFGTPQSLDGFKAFGCDFFDLKFAGAIPFVLSLFAVFRKQAPGLPKFLFVTGLAIPFTPLTHWFYSRCTVLFALGCAWLAAWALANLPDAISARAWRNIARFGTAMAGIWLLASAAVLLVVPRLAHDLHRLVEKGLAADKASRHDWMISRADEFLSNVPIWHWRNLVLVIAVSMGLFAAWRLSRQTARIRLWVPVLILCTFGEIFTWSRTWITFSDKPGGAPLETLYPVPEWALRLKAEMSDGGFLFVHDRNGDFDYMQLNAPSAIGIPCIQGYETIKPAALEPADPTGYDPDEFAALGVSHVLVSPGSEPPETLSRHWRLVMDTDKLRLFRNPAFQSRFMAELSDGRRIPLGPESATPNSLRLSIPSGTVFVEIAQPWHRKWIARLDVTPSRAASVARTPLGTAKIAFTGPVERDCELSLRFTP